MKVSESPAFGGRWFDALATADHVEPEVQEKLGDLPNLDVLADCSDIGHTGYVSVAFLTKDNLCCYLEWIYGSCDHCDEWEEFGEAHARREIFRAMVLLPKDEFTRFAAAHHDLKEHLNTMTLRLWS